MNILPYIFRISGILPQYAKFLMKPVIKVLSVLHEQIQDPILYLGALSPDNGRSCICDNHISKEPSYDLQIIIPVYNVEKYVKSCMDSVVNQKTKYSYKVVVVNDGSPDNSREILKEYESYENIEIIDQENKGFSGARNTGLANIDAEYVMFVDSDDVLCDGAIEKMLDAVKHHNVDILQGHYCYWKDNAEIPGRKMNLGLYHVKKVSGFPWGKIYRSSLFERVQFPQGYWYEDTINRLILFNFVKTVFVIPDAVYKYRVNNQGISQTSVGKLRTIDTVWVTLRLWNDLLQLTEAVTSQMVENLVIQTRANINRLIYINNMNVVYACYMVVREYIYPTITDVDVNDKNAIKFKHALETNNFSLFLETFF